MQPLQSVRVIFADKKYNYSTSVSATTKQSDIESYFKNTTFNIGGVESDYQTSIDVFFICQNVKCDKEQNDRLTIVNVFDPKANTRSACIYDPLLGAALGFTNHNIYYPVGGSNACNCIVKHGGGGLVIGSINQWHKLIHCHDNVYRVYHDGVE